MRLPLIALVLASLAVPAGMARAQVRHVPPLAFPDTATARQILVGIARWVGDSSSRPGPAQFVLPSDSLLRGCGSEPACRDFAPDMMKSLSREFGRALTSSPIGDRILVIPFVPKLASPTEAFASIHRGRAVCGPRGTVGLGAYALRLRRDIDGRWEVFDSRPTAAIDMGCAILPQTRRTFDSVSYLAEHPLSARPGGPTYQAPITYYRVVRRGQVSDSLYLVLSQRLAIVEDSLLTVDLVAACGQPSFEVTTVTLTVYSGTVLRVARAAQCNRSISNPPRRLEPYLELENLVHEVGVPGRAPRRP